MANGHSTEPFKVILTIHADATEKLDPILVGSSERDNLGHILSYLAGHVQDRDSYSSIDTVLNREIIDYLGL